MNERNIFGIVDFFSSRTNITHNRRHQTIWKKPSVQKVMVFTIFCRVLLYTIIVSASPVQAASYGITVRDVQITPTDAEIGDTLNIRVSYRVDGPRS